MPKDTTPGVSSVKTSLRRNQACKACRKRKLKCDAQRPHCATCVKQWQALISVPAPVGYAHPTEPHCQYDNVDGLVLAPDVDPLERIRSLEDTVTQLKNQLEQQHQSQQQQLHVQQQDQLRHQQEEHRKLNPPYQHPYPQRIRSVSPDRYYMTPGTSTSSPAAGGSTSSPGQGIALPHAGLDVKNSVLLQIGDTVKPSTPSNGTSRLRNLSTSSPGEFMDLLFAGWNPDLPDPPILNHYIDVFFRCDPAGGSRVLHRPSFLASMHLPPNHPDFPHSAILHAICASASRWAPQNVTTEADGSRRDHFAEYHAGKTRQYIDKTMSSGADIFSVMQACILLSWYLYAEGRWVEVWIFGGFLSRVSVPFRLNYPGTYSASVSSSPGAYLAPPKDPLDLEKRRRTWWMICVFDRISSVGGWMHSLDIKDLATELPLRHEDFLAETHIHSNPQNIHTPEVYTSHPPQYTDPFTLLIKAVMLFGQVTDFNTRGSLHGTAPPKNKSPYYLEGFKALDEVVGDRFLRSLPSKYQNNYGVNEGIDGSILDTDLYMVHIIPHAATITLHNPYIEFTDPTCQSTARCVNSARSILQAYYLLSSSSLDISRLHPFVVICWYLAAVVQVQLCKYFIEIGDTEREATVWSEINILRFAMLEYGSRSPIGVRQERLLQGLMTQIVKMTAQKDPLQARVGVPLFPFSHATLFAQKSDTTALLPATPAYEQGRSATDTMLSPMSGPASTPLPSSTAWSPGPASNSPSL